MTAQLQAVGPALATARPEAPRPGQGRQWWRRSRPWIGVVALIIIAGVIIGLLSQQPVNSYLNPASTDATGTHALADVLTGLGRRVTTVTSAGAAAADATGGSVIVVTSPYYLTRPQLTALARARGDVVLVEPDSRTLAAFRTGLRLATTGAAVASIPAACTLYAAVLAGSADMGGTLLAPVRGREAAGAEQCYPVDGDSALVQVRVRGHLVTVLGTGYPLTNAALASQGNAALALNLLDYRRIIWLVPPVAAVTLSGPATPRSFASLVPLAAYLIAIQLTVALLLAAAWRARRLGPLVAEPLPVVVRAAETVEGHARLYQSRRARGRAADALREALIGRVGPVVGLPRGASRDAVVAALAARSARSAGQVSDLLFGQAPESDQALVHLARDLDEFEREVGSS
jgi:hypothetical protein